MKRTWVVVAHHAGARIYERVGGRYDLRRTIAHPPGYEGCHERALAFAGRIAELLAAGRIAGSYDDLVLVTAPYFAGLIHGLLDESTVERVKKTVYQDLGGRNDHEIASHVERSLCA